MLACYVLTLSDLHVWCLTLAIHEMTAINEITAKTDHVSFTCNWFVVLRKWAHRCMFLQKRCSKNISNCDESISRKGSFLKVVMNVLSKRTLPQLFFYIATLIIQNFQNVQSIEIVFLFTLQDQIFLFLWLFLMTGAVVQHSYIM